MIDQILHILEIFYNEKGRIARYHAKRRYKKLAPLLARIPEMWWGSTDSPLLFISLDNHDEALLSELRPLLGGLFNPATMTNNLMTMYQYGYHRYYAPREYVYSSLVSYWMRPYLQAYINMRS